MQIRFWCPEWADELRSLQIQKCNLNIGFFFYIGLDRNTIYVVVLVKWLLRCQYGIWQDSCLLSTSVCVCVCVLVAQSCPTLCHPLDCSPPGFSAHGIFQTRIMEWVAISSSRGIFPTWGSNPHLLCSCIACEFFTPWAIQEALLSTWAHAKGLVLVAVVQSLSPVRLLATPWTTACQASLPMGFSRQEC